MYDKIFCGENDYMRTILEKLVVQCSFALAGSWSNSYESIVKNSCAGRDLADFGDDSLRRY